MIKLSSHHWAISVSLSSGANKTSPQSNLRRARRSCRTIQHSLHWLQWDAPNSPPKLPLLRRSPPKSNTPIPSPTPLTTPNSIRIQSAILPQYRCADRQTWDDMVNHNSALLSYSDSERRANNICLTALCPGLPA